MKNVSRGTLFLVLAFFVSIFSISLSYGAYNSMEEATGVSYKVEKKLNVKIDELSTMALNDEGIMVLREPNLVDNKINYSMVLNYLNSYGQFQFSINNKGKTDIRVSNIIIEGLNENSEFVEVKIDNLKVGDIIKTESLYNNVKVVTTYKKQYFDSSFTPQSITLNNVSISIEFEMVE